MNNIAFNELFIDNTSILKERYLVKKQVLESDDPDKFFQNSIWIFLYELVSLRGGNLKMNCDINDADNVFNNSNGFSKSVDTIIETDEMFLFIESTVQRSVNTKVETEIAKFLKYKAEASKNKKKNIAFIFHSKYIPNDNHLDLLFDSEINFISEQDLNNFIELKNNYPSLAYFQFLNFLFGPKNNSSNSSPKDGELIHSLVQSKNGKTFIKVPSLVSSSVRFGTSYTFNIHPGEILMMSNVPHRKPSIKDNSSANLSFQRMIDNSKIKKIRDYISKGGSFPTNIIVNLENITPSSFENNKLKIPLRFSTFTIIDGQHRLFSYLDDESEVSISNQARITVTGYVGLTPEQQMDIFIGINENQKPVDKNLLWDLYTDLYTQDQTHSEFNINNARKSLISEYIKKINIDTEHALYSKFQYPSSPHRKKGFLKLSSIGNELYSSELFRDNDFYRTIIRQVLGNMTPELFKENEEKIIFDFFNSVKNIAGDEWLNNKWYKDNRAISVYFKLMKSILNHISNIAKKDGGDSYLLSTRDDFDQLNSIFADYLKPLHNAIICFDADEYEKFMEKGGGNIVKMYNKSIRIINKQHNSFCKDEIYNSDFTRECNEILNILRTEQETEKIEAKESYIIVPKVYDETGNVDTAIKQAKEWSGEIGMRLNSIRKESIRDSFNKVINSFSNGLGGRVIIGVKENTASSGYNRFIPVGIRKCVLEKYSNNYESLKNEIQQNLRLYNPLIAPKIKIGNYVYNDESITLIIVEVLPIDHDSLNSNQFRTIQHGINKNKLYRRIIEHSDPLIPEKYNSHKQEIRQKLNEQENRSILFSEYADDITNTNGDDLINQLPKNCPSCNKNSHKWKTAIVTFGLRKSTDSNGYQKYIWQSRCVDCR